MTVKITYSHAHLDDCTDTTGWTQVNSADPLTGVTLTVLHGDWFQIEGTCDAAADEWVKYWYNLNPDISTNTYKYCLVKWKTSVDSAGLQAKVNMDYTVGDEMFVLGYSDPANTWQVSALELTAGKLVDNVEIYADDNPDAVAAGTFQVTYDFLLFFKDWYTFPFIRGTEELEGNANVAYLKVPGRVGNITQYLGQDSPTYRLSGKMDTNTGWKDSGIYGGAFFEVFHNQFQFPWQWLESDLIKAKVTMPTFKLSKVPDSVATRNFSLEFRKYDLSDGSNEYWYDYYGLV